MEIFPSGENTAQEPIANAIRGIVWHEIKGNTAQLCLRAAAVFLPHIFSLKNEKYCAAVASVSWLTDAAYPLRVYTVFLRFPNFELSQKSRLGLLAKLCGVAQEQRPFLFSHRTYGLDARCLLQYNYYISFNMNQKGKYN